MRPADKQYQPWLDRVSGQLDAAYAALEQELQQHPLAVVSQAGISTAVGWQFTRQMLPDCSSPTQYPAIHALSEHAETLPQFIAAPYGDGTYHAAS